MPNDGPWQRNGPGCRGRRGGALSVVMPAAPRVAAARAQQRRRARIAGDACVRVVCLCSLLLVGLLRAVGAQQPEQQQRAVQRQLLRRPELERQRELQEQAQPQLVTVVGKLHKAGSVLISDFFGGPVRRQRLADVEFVKYLSIRRPGCAREFFSRGERCPPGSWLDVACNYTVERALAPPEPSERVRPTALTMAGDSVAAGRSRPPKALVLLMNNAVEHDWETTPYESLPPECKAMAAAGAYRYISGMRDPFSAAVSDYLYTKVRGAERVSVPAPMIGRSATCRSPSRYTWPPLRALTPCAHFVERRAT